MAWWSIFVKAGVDKYSQQKDANKRESAANETLGGLDVELAGLRDEESSIALQLADRRRAREWKPISTPRGRYQYLMRRGGGGGGGFVQKSSREGRVTRLR